MLRLHGFALGAALVFVSACERAQEAPTPDVSAAPPALSGVWAVEGVTVETASGKTRQITGTILLNQEGGRYTSSFDLDTAFASDGGPIHANVIGEGEGTVSGRTLHGTSHTQILISGAPNVDTGFAYVPRQVGTRIVSTTKATIADDGTIAVEIESAPEPGESYAPTKTTLKGSYVSTGRIPSEP